jgi:hypothetical protein
MTIGFVETSIEDIIAGIPYKVKWIDNPQIGGM